MSHKEWRSICDHAGSPTCLIAVKSHLEFSSFGDALLLIVPIAAICSSKGMIPLETIKRDMTTLGIITKSLVGSLPYRSLE